MLVMVPAPRPRTLIQPRELLGGSAGNELLTSAVAVTLTVLLAAEGITLLDLRGLRGPHMFIGVLLIGPLLAKLASTGYRFARYYTGARPYREKGPPHIALRLLAPMLVAATVGVFGTGVALLALGHSSDGVMFAHQACFAVWSACFGAHFLAYLPRMSRSLASRSGARHRREVGGGTLRLAAVLGSLAGGLVLALAVTSAIAHWQPFAGA
jgi:hypothetical protein